MQSPINERIQMKPIYFSHRHIPTGKLCHVMAINGAMAYCDFGAAPYPFCNVKLSDLERI